MAMYGARITTVRTVTIFDSPRTGTYMSRDFDARDSAAETINVITFHVIVRRRANVTFTADILHERYSDNVRGSATCSRIAFLSYSTRSCPAVFRDRGDRTKTYEPPPFMCFAVLHKNFTISRAEPPRQIVAVRSR